MNYPKVVLKAKREGSLLRKHPWVFSGAIQKIILLDDQADIDDGDIVEVVDHRESTLGMGHFSNGSIAVRMLSFEYSLIDNDFWTSKLERAFQLRKSLGLTNNLATTAYRLIHAEGDGLPGLIIDIYNQTAILQAHSAGMANALEQIATSLTKVDGLKIASIYSKSEKSLHKQGNDGQKDGYLQGSENHPQLVKENELTFEIDWVEGQKTGFFIDQRENRKLLQLYSKNKKVLNTFCYSGGFSVYALAANASEVHSVDSSAKAIELTNRNIELNFNERNQHKSFVRDTLKFLNESDEKYDVIILDPPAYAKSKSSQHKAVQAYKRINEKALKMINEGGILFTFSCSQVIHRQLFENTITAAAISAKRSVRILHHLSQPADHPVSIFHPEGEYLKGLVLYIER